MSDIALTQLATLLVETDFLRAESDERNLVAAREAAQRAMHREIEAMHDGADAIATGAWVQGLTAAAAGGTQCYASLAGIDAETDACKARLEALDKGGRGLAGIAEPAGNLVGDAPKARADTHAAQARNEAEQANVRADEAEQHRDRVERHGDKVLDLVESTLDSEQQGHLAILGNF